MAEEIHKKNEEFAKKNAKQRAKDASVFKVSTVVPYRRIRIYWAEHLQTSDTHAMVLLSFGTRFRSG